MSVKSLNRQETEDFIIDLYYNQKKTFREIQQIVRKSPRDIKVILNKVEPERSSLSIPVHAYRLFSEGKSPIEVATILNIREPEATQFNLEYWKLSQLDCLSRIYKEANGNILPLVDLFRQMKAAGLTGEDVIKLLLMANNDIRSIEQKCRGLKREEADIAAKNLHAARTFQQLSNDISEESKILEERRTSCKEECLELDKLRLQKVELESVVREFQAVEQSLANQRHVLILAFLSVIDSCRKDPKKFNVLYHNLSTSAISDMRLAEFDQIDQNHYGLSTKQLCYPPENTNDITYWRFLVGEAEKFFNKSVNDLEQVCINQLIKILISASKSAQLTRSSYLDSGIVLPIQTYGNEKKDPLL